MDKIQKLKRQATKQYLKYKEILDSYSCGVELANHVSNELTEAKTAFNNTMKELEKIDPEFPAIFL